MITLVYLFLHPPELNQKCVFCVTSSQWRQAMYCTLMGTHLQRHLMHKSRLDFLHLNCVNPILILISFAIRHLREKYILLTLN